MPHNKPTIAVSVPLTGDALKSYWWRRLAATWRHGGINAAAKQFQTMWTDAKRDGHLEHYALLCRISKALSAAYEYLPQFTIAEALTIQTGKEVDELIKELQSFVTAQKGDETHDESNHEA